MFTDNTDGGLGPGMTRYLRELAVFVCLRSFFLANSRILVCSCSAWLITESPVAFSRGQL